MARFDPVKFSSLSLNLSLACILKHAKAPGLRFRYSLGYPYSGVYNDLLLASFTTSAGLARGRELLLLDNWLRFGSLAERGEINLTLRIDCLLFPHASPENLCIAEEALISLHEAVWALHCLNNFRLV